MELVKMSDIIRIYNTYDEERAREEVMKLPCVNIEEELKEAYQRGFKDAYLPKDEQYKKFVEEVNKNKEKIIESFKGE